MIKILAVTVVVWVALFFFVRLLEHKMAFYPCKSLEGRPADLGLSYEDIWVTSSSGVNIHGWFLPRAGAEGTVLFLHGNAGNISHRMEKIVFFHELGLNVAIIDYRGYGQSTGIPSEKGFSDDALAAFDFLVSRKDLHGVPILVYGESIGGAVAVEVASRRSVSALIVDSSFSSIRDMARHYFPWIPSFVLSLQFASDAKAGKIACPKLFMHSREDEIVPFALGWRLYDVAARPKEFLELHGGHNENFTKSKEDIYRGIAEFLGRYVFPNR